MTTAESGSLRKTAESQLVQRIIASPGFVRSPRLSTFLLYVCERMFEGRLEEVSEQQIGVNVFERPAGYLPAEDSIVRSHARLLRQKLDDYFQTEGASEELLLTIPRGSYVPVFGARSASPAEAVAEAAAVESVAPERKRRPWVWAIAIMAAAGAGYWIGSARSAPAAPRAHPLWTRIFSGARTLFVPADSGLVMFQNLSRKSVELADYANRDFAATPGAASGAAGRVAQDVGSRRYTTMVDLNFAVHLLRAPWAVPDRLQIRYARDVKLDDLKGGNVILSGVAEANPWVELFERKMNFQFAIDEETRTFRVSNRHPAVGESAAYFNLPSDPLRRAWGLVAFQPGLAAGDSVLMVEGTTVAGTEAAADFALNDEVLLPALRRITGQRGEVPWFEILVATTNMGGQAPRSELVSIRKD